MKVAQLKRLHTVWFQLYDILEEAKLERLQIISDCCVKGGWQMTIKYVSL